MYKLIRKAGHKAAEARKIAEFLERVGVVDIPTLENSPPRIGTKLFGYDIYSFIQSVVEASKMPDPPPKKRSVKETDNGNNDSSE